MQILNNVGGHDINVYAGAQYDPQIRKYRGGHLVAVIPYSGSMLSAKMAQEPDDPIIYDGVEIPTQRSKIVSADPVPDDNCYHIVSALYLAAVKAMGGDTNHLLTIAAPVVDDSGRVVGVTGLNRN